MSEQEDQFSVIYEGHPKLNSLSKIPVSYFCSKFFLFVGNVGNWLVLKGLIQLSTTGFGGACIDVIQLRRQRL